MPRANDLVDEISMASNEHGQATKDGDAGGQRMSSPPTRTVGRGRGLTVTQAIAIAVGLLVISAIIANAARSDRRATTDAETTTTAQLTAAPTTLVAASPTIGGTVSAAATTAPVPSSAVTTASATTTARPSGVITTAGATVATTTPGATTATTNPSAVLENPPGPLLPTGQPWPEANLESGRLVVRGTVPSAAAQDATVAMLEQLVGGGRVTSELVVDAKVPRVLYVPVRLSAPLAFAAGDGDLIELEKSVLVLWGTFLRDHASAEVLVVARGPKPLPPDLVAVASARAVAAGRELIGSGATAKQIKSLVVGDSSVLTGRLEVSRRHATAARHRRPATVAAHARRHGLVGVSAARRRRDLTSR